MGEGLSGRGPKWERAADWSQVRESLYAAEGSLMCRRQNVVSLSLRPYGCGLPQSFHDFVALCLIKDPNTRPSAKQLMQHAFIKQRQVPTSAPGLPGSPLPHLHWGSPPPHVHRDGAHPAHTWPGLGSPLPRLHRDQWLSMARDRPWLEGVEPRGAGLASRLRNQSRLWATAGRRP